MNRTKSSRRKRWFFARAMSRAYREMLEKRKRNRSNAGKRTLFAEALEPRVLFSGTPVPVDPEMAEDAENQESIAQTAEFVTEAAESGIDGVDSVHFDEEADADFSEEDLERLAREAVSRWEESGLTQEQIDALEQINYVVTDLGERRVGAMEGNAIYLDDDGGGQGWFIDETEGLDEEFVAYDGYLDAITDEAMEGIDLLTAIMHEQGHILGLLDLEDVSEIDGLMYLEIEEGMRRLPETGEAEDAEPFSLTETHFLHTALTQVNVSDQAEWDAAVAGLDATKEVVFSGAGGTITISGAVTVGALHFESGLYTLSGGEISIAPSGLSIQTDVDAEIESVLTNTGDLTKSGLGTLTLSGANSSATGATTVSSGILAWGAVDTLPSGVVTVENGATVDLTTLSGSANTNSARVYVIEGAGSMGQGALINSSGSLVGSNAAVKGLTLSGDATINAAARLDVGGSIDFSDFTLSKIGGNTLAFRSTVNSPQGSFVIEEGSSYIEQNDMTIGSIIVNDGSSFGIYAYNGSPGRTLTADIIMNGSALLRHGSNGTPSSANTYAGTITVNGGTATFRNAGFNSNTSDVVFDSVISGTGTIVLDGNDAARSIAFNSANTFSGSVQTIDQGSFILGDSLALQNATLDMGTGVVGSVGFGTLSEVVLGGLTGSNGIVLENAMSEAVALAVGGNGLDTTFSGELSGTGSLEKIGDGTLTLAGANTYSGSTAVSAGTLEVDGVIGSGSPAGTVTVAGGATLSGDGLVNAPIESSSTLANISASGNLSLGDGTATGFSFNGSLEVGGNSVTLSDSNGATVGDVSIAGGTLTTSGISMSGGDALSGNGTIVGAVDVNLGSVDPGGPGALATLNIDGDLIFDSTSESNTGELSIDVGGDGSDLVDVDGQVVLTNVVLTVSAFGAAPTNGQQVTLVDNDGSDAVVGTFAGLADGDEVVSLSSGAIKAFISYFGGDGNDITISFYDTANPTPITVRGPDGDTSFQVRIINDTLQILQEGSIVESRPLDAVGSLIINGDDLSSGGEGNDTFTLDYSDSRLSDIAISIDGMDPTTGTGDSLVIENGTFGVVTHNFTAGDSGGLDLDGDNVADISYTGLEPVDMTGSTATDLVFNLPAGADSAHLSDIGGGTLRLESTDATPTFESTDFAVPSGSITINGGGDDTVEISTAISVNGLVIDAGDIVLGGDVTSANGDQSYTGAVTLGNDVTLDTSAGNGSISVNGTIDGDGVASRDFALNSGSGNVNVTGAVGASEALGTILVQDSGTVDFDATVTAVSFEQVDRDADTTVDGLVTLSGALRIEEGDLVMNAGLFADEVFVGIGDGTVGAEGAIATATVTAGVVSIGNGDGTVEIGRRDSGSGATRGTVDFGGASSVTIDVESIRMGTSTTGGAYSEGDLTLSLAGDNTINASTVLMSEDVGGNNQSLSTSSDLHLGAAANVLNVDVLTVGGLKGVGIVDIAAGGTLTLSGDSNAETDLRIGYNKVGTGTRPAESALDLTGGTFYATLDLVEIGVHGTSTGAGKGRLVMDAGTVTANRVVLGEPGTTTDPATQDPFTQGTITMNGGTFTVANGVMDGGGSTAININNGTFTVTDGGLQVDDLLVGQNSTTALLTVNGGDVFIGDGDGSNFDIGRSAGVTTKGTVDFSGASSVTIDVDDFRLGSNGSGSSQTQGDLTLSSAGSNTVTAAVMTLGFTESGGNINVSTSSDLHLGGGANDFNVDTLTVGGRKSVGSIDILSGGTFTLAGDSVAETDLRIGHNDSTGTGTNPATSIVDLTGGTFNATLDKLIIGLHGGLSGSGQGSLTYEAGTITANTITLSDTNVGGTSTNSQNTDGTLNHNGGSLTVGTVNLGEGDSTLTISGGTFKVTTAFNLDEEEANSEVSAVTLSGGTLDLSGVDVVDRPGADAFTFTGGTLKDVDDFGVDLTQEGGTFQVGADSTVDITTIDGDFTGTAGAIEIDLDGTAGAGAVGGHDQIVVDDSSADSAVSLSGVSLNVNLNYAATVGDSFVILANDETGDAIVGEFEGLPEGSLIFLDFSGADYAFTITYFGGDNNDVELTSLGAAETSVEIVGGDLVITDINGGMSDDAITISDDGNGNYIISDPSQILTTSIPGAVRVDASTIQVSKTDVTGGLVVDLKADAGGGDIVNLASDLDFSGDVTITADTINLAEDINAEDVTFNGDVNQTSTSQMRITADNVTFNGTTTLSDESSSNNFELNVSGALTNSTGSTFDLNGGRLRLIGDTEFVNNGTFETGDNTESLIYGTGSGIASVTNNGTFVHNGTQLRLYVGISNAGTFNFDNPDSSGLVTFNAGGGTGPGGMIESSGVFNISGSADNRFSGIGSFTNRSGGEVNISGDLTLDSGASFTNEVNGNVDLEGASYSITLNDTTLVNNGTFTWIDGADGTKSIGGSDGEFLNNGTFIHAHQGGDDNLIVTGSATFTNASGATFDFQERGDLQIVGNAILNNSGNIVKSETSGEATYIFGTGTLNVLGGEIRSEAGQMHVGLLGSQSTAAGVTWTADGGDISLGGTWEGTFSGSSANGGHVELIAIGNAVIASGFTVGTSGVVFDIDGDGFSWLADTIDTQGNSLVNTGTFVADGGSLKTLTGEFINEGVFEVESDFTIDGGELVNASGGNLDFASGTVTLTAAADVIRNQSGGILTISDAGTSSIVGDGAIVNEPGATATWTGGNLRLADANVEFRNAGDFEAAGGSQRILGGAGTFLNTGTFTHGLDNTLGSNNIVTDDAGTFQNEGLFEFTSDQDFGFDGGYTFVNAANGVIQKTAAGSEDPAQFFSFGGNGSGTLDNQGAVQVLGGTFRVATSLQGFDDIAISQQSGGTLTGGTWIADASGGGTAVIQLSPFDDTDLGPGNGITEIGAGATVRLIGSGASLDQLNNNLSEIDGSLTVNGTADLSVAAAGVTVGSGGLLAGSGTVSGDVTLATGSTLSPGDGAADEGNLTIDGNLTVDGTVDIDVSGMDATDHDMVTVTGNVDLGGSTLNIVENGADFNGLSGGEEIFLVTVEGPGSVTGTFTGRSENSIVSIGGRDFRISYMGGDGNDVVLTAVTVPETQVSLDGSGNLVITDINGGGSDDELSISAGYNADADDDGYTISDPNQVLTSSIPGAIGINENTIFIPFEVITGGEIQFDGADGTDVLTIDVGMNGAAILQQTIVFIGGESAGDNDTLRILGTFGGTVTHNMVAGESGDIDLDSDGSAEIVYSELEPVDMSGSTVDDFVFNLPAGADNAQLSETAGVFTLESTDGSPTFESTIFMAPTGSIIINGGSGDTLTVANDLDLSGADADGTGLVLNVETIFLGGGIDTGGSDQTFNGTVTLTDDVTLEGDNVTFNDTLDSDATDRALVINSSGLIRFTEDVGQINPLASITTGGTGTVSFETNATGLTGPIPILLDLNASLDGSATDTIAPNFGIADEFGVLDDNPAVTVNTSPTTGFAGITRSYALPGGSGANGEAGIALANSGDAAASLSNLGGSVNNRALFEAWIKPDAATFGTNDQVIYESGGGSGSGITLEGTELVFRVIGNGVFNEIRYDLATDGANANALGGDAPTAEFFQIGASFDVTTDISVLYLNGIEVGRATLASGDITSVSGGDGLGIGAVGEANMGGYGSGTLGFDALHGEIAIFRIFESTDEASDEIMLSNSRTLANTVIDVTTQVTTSGAQDYQNAIVLGANTVIVATDATFGSTIDDDGDGTTPSGLVVNASGTTTFSGDIGSTNAIDSITTDAAGSTTINSSSIETALGQAYNDAVTSTATTFDASAIVFGSTSTFNAATTTITTSTANFIGAAEFAGGNVIIDASSDVAFDSTLDVVGTTNIDSGNATFAGVTTFGDDVTITSTSDTAFEAAVNGGSTVALLVNSEGVSRFTGGSIGSLVTSGFGRTEFAADITFTGDVDTTIRDRVLLTENVTIVTTGGGDFIVNSSIDSEDGEANTLGLVLTQGDAFLNGDIGADGLGALSNDAGLGAIDVSGTGELFLGNRRNAAADLASLLYYNASEDATGTELQGNSSHDLTLSGVTVNNSPATGYDRFRSSWVFDSATDALQALSIDNGNLTGNPSDEDGAVELWFKPDSLAGGGQILWESGGTGAGSAIVLEDDVLSFIAKGGINANQVGRIDYTLPAGIETEFIQVVAVYDRDSGGGGEDRTFLYVNGDQVGSATGLQFNDWIGTDGMGIGGRNATVGGTDTDGSDVTPEGDNDAAEVLPTESFQGEIAMFRYYREALSTGDVASAFEIQTLPVVVKTTGDQTYDVAVNVRDVSFTGNDVTFNNTLDSETGFNGGITVNSIGNGTTTFAGAVGGDVAISSLTTNVDGVTLIDGGTVTISGDGGAFFGDALQIGSDTIITSQGVGDVIFGATVDSESTETNDLTVATTGGGKTNFVGDVGSTDPLANLTTDDTTFGGVPAIIEGAQGSWDASADDGADNTVTNQGTDTSNSDLDLDTTITRDAVVTDRVGITHAWTFPGGTTADTATTPGNPNSNPGSKGGLFSFGPFSGLDGGASGETDVTFEIWFKPTDLMGGNQVLFETGGGTGIGLYLSDNILEVQQTSGGTDFSVDITGLEGDFIHALISVDQLSPGVAGGTTTLYLNGQFAGSNTAGSDWDGGDAAGLGTIGGENAGGISGGNQGKIPFDGQVAIFRQYNGTALSADEASVNYAAIAGPQPVEITTTEDQNFAGVVTLDADVTLNGEDVIFASTVDLGDNDLSVNVTGIDSKFQGVVSGTGDVTKNGTGTLSFSSANTYTGLTTIAEGLAVMGDLAAFGSDVVGTTVEDGGAVDLNGQPGFITETFTISGDGIVGDPDNGAIFNGGAAMSNDGEFDVILAADASIGGDGNRFDVTNITDNGNGFTLTKVGNNDIWLDGSVNVANLVIENGIYGVENSDGPINDVRGTVTIEAAGTLSTWRDRNLDATIVMNGGAFRTNHPTSTIGFAGTITLNGADNRFIVRPDATLNLTSNIDGTGSFVKQDGGLLISTGTNTYSGTTDVQAGTLLVNSTHTGGGDYAVAAGATLGGIGTIDANVIADGIVATGDPAVSGGIGNLTVTGNVTVNNEFQLQIDGANSDTLLVTVPTDTVTLGGSSTLVVTDANDPAAGSTTLVIDNAGSDAVSGTFNGLAEGATVTSQDGNQYIISYAGGDGNDVVLFEGAAETNVDLSGGVLTITDINTEASGDNLSITFDGTHYVISDPNFILSTSGLSGGQVTRPDVNTVRVLASAVTSINVVTENTDPGVVDYVTIGSLPANIAGDVTVNAENISVGTTIVAGGDITLNGSTTLTASVNLDGDDVTLNGPVALGANDLTVTVDGTTGSQNGGISGTGSFTKAGAGTFTLNGTGQTSNSYTGLTTVSAGQLDVGGSFVDDGAIQGDILVENGGTLQLHQNQVIANGSSLTIDAGGTVDWNNRIETIGNLEGAGEIIDNTNTVGLTLDNLSGTHTFTGDILGGGGFLVRGGIDASGTQELSGGTYNFNRFAIGQGTVTITDGATVTATAQTIVAVTSGQIPGIAEDPVTATLNIESGSLTTASIITGNRNSGTSNPITAVINQTGGDVRTTGSAGEGNGVRMSHWNNTDTTYNLSGGTLTIDNNFALSTATTGTGRFTQTGGVLTVNEIDVNSRTDASGNGTFELLGGTLNLGSGGINSDSAASPGTVILGGQGGTVIATAASTSAIDAILLGSGVNRVGFDTNSFDIVFSGVLSGTGGFEKEGVGTLTLNGDNSYDGNVDVIAGTLELNGDHIAGTVVGGYRDDFQTGTFPTGWQYLWNANGDVVDPANYDVLLADNGRWETVADGSFPDAAPGSFLNLTSSGGHPGASQSGGNPYDRYAIAAFTIPSAGDYAVMGGFLDPLTTDGEGNDVRIFVTSGGSTTEVFQTAGDDAAFDFGTIVGTLSAGDVIYVATGTDGTGAGNSASSDSFVWDFNIVAINSSTITVQSGATLGGSGSTTSSVDVEAGGFVAPSLDTVETLGSGSITISGELDFQIDGETSSDLIDVTGTVTLGGTLDIEELTAGTPTYGQSITVIRNDGTDAVSGIFSGLPEGATVTDDDGDTYTISYSGGDGNDVVLFVGEAETNVDLSGGVLTISDINNESADQISVTFDAMANEWVISDPNLVISTTGLGSGEVSRPDAYTVRIDASVVTGGVVIETANPTDGGATDAVTIGSSSGDPVVFPDSLTINAENTVFAGDVTINGSSSITGSTATFEGTTDLNGQTLSLSLSSGGSNASGANLNLNGGTLRLLDSTAFANDGTTLFSGGNGESINGNGVFTNNATFNHTTTVGSDNFATGDTVTFVNATTGTFFINGGGDVEMRDNSMFDNQGLLQKTTGTTGASADPSYIFSRGGDFTNSGTLQSDAGHLNIAGGNTAGAEFRSTGGNFVTTGGATGGLLSFSGVWDELRGASSIGGDEVQISNQNPASLAGPTFAAGSAVTIIDVQGDGLLWGNGSNGSDVDGNGNILRNEGILRIVGFDADIVGTGSVENGPAGTLRLEDGALSLDGADFTNNGTVEFIDTNFTINGTGTFTNNADFDHQATGAADNLQINDTVSFVNSATGTFDFQGEGDVNLQGDSTFTNDGTVIKTVGTGNQSYIFSTGGNFINTGTLQSDGGRLAIAGGASSDGYSSMGGTFRTTGSGNIQLSGLWTELTGAADRQGGDIELSNENPAGTTGGRFSSATGGTVINVTGDGLQWKDAIVDTSNGQITNTGLILIQDGGTTAEILLTGGNELVNTTGTIDFQSGTLELDATNIRNQSTFDVTTTATSRLEGTGGQLINDAGALLAFTDEGTFEIAIDGIAVVNDGTFDWNGGGTLDLEAAGTIFDNNGTANFNNAFNRALTGAGTFNNDGTFNHNQSGGNDNFILAGDVTFDNNGTFDFNGQGDMQFQSGSTSTFQNDGLFVKSVAGNDPSFVFSFDGVSGTFIQSATGTVRSEGGRLRITAGTNTSDAGGTWTADGGNIEIASTWTGTITGTSAAPNYIGVTNANNGSIQSDLIVGAGGLNVDVDGNGFFWDQRDIDTTGGDLTNLDFFQIVAGGPKTLSGDNRIVTANTATTTFVSGGEVTTPGSASLQIDDGGTVNGAGSFEGEVNGDAGSLIETGGDLTLGDSSTNAFETAGDIIVNSGDTLTLNDSGLSLLGASTYIQAGGTLSAPNGLSMSGGDILSGGGTVEGNLNVNSGTVTPGDAGDSTQTLTFDGNINVGSNGTLVIEIDSENPGEFDLLDVTGTVTLNANSQLNLTADAGLDPMLGTAIVFISNDAADAVNGTFSGLPEGVVVNLNGDRYHLTYAWNPTTGLRDGNDVAIVRNRNPEVTFDVANTTENVATTLTGQIENADGADSHTVTIDWGDANDLRDSIFDLPATASINANNTFTSRDGAATLVVTSIDRLNDLLNFTVEHNYIDDGASDPNYPGSDGSGSNILTVEVTVDDGEFNDTEQDTDVTVTNTDPTVTLQTTTINENETAIVQGTLADPGILDSHRLTIDWDDPNDSTPAAVFDIPALFSADPSTGDRTPTLVVGQIITGSDGTELEIIAIRAATGEFDFEIRHYFVDDGLDPGTNPSTTYVPEDGLETNDSTVSATVLDDDAGSGTGNTTVTVNNVAPDPSTDSATTTEDATVTIDLLAGATDVGTLDDIFLDSIDTTGTAGSVTINPDNTTVIYDPGDAFQYLAKGETATDTFRYSLIDDDGSITVQQVTVTIIGQNDAPILRIDRGTVYEGGVGGPETTVGNVFDNDTDVDGSDGPAVTRISFDGQAFDGSTNDGGRVNERGNTRIDGAYGTLRISANGEFVYTLNSELPATRALRAGDKVFEVFTYTVKDFNGGTISQKISILVNGADGVSIGGLQFIGGGNILEGFRYAETSAIFDSEEDEGEQQPVLTLMPTYSGTAAPGTIIKITIYTPDGGFMMNGTATVVADLTGNWTATMNGLVMDGESPYFVQIEQQAPMWNAGMPGVFRTYFAPAINGSMASSEVLSVDSVFGRRLSSVAIDQMTNANENPLGSNEDWRTAQGMP